MQLMCPLPGALQASLDSHAPAVFPGLRELSKEREAGVVHHRYERASEFVAADGFEGQRLPTLDRRTRRLLRVRTLPCG